MTWVSVFEVLKEKKLSTKNPMCSKTASKMKEKLRHAQFVRVERVLPRHGVLPVGVQDF